MKCVRFENKRTGTKHLGILDGEVIHGVYGSIDTYWRITGDTFALKDVQLLAPCVPKQIICASFNYQAHADECGVQVTPKPSIFGKAAHTVIGTGAQIICPKEVKDLGYGAELAVVVKKRMKNVPIEEVPKYILGYTCANDITARDIQRSETQWFRSKSFDTFCPLGPWLETELNPADIEIKLSVNGQVRQQARTSEMLYNAYEILSYISHNITLDAGDLVLTGTPVGFGSLHPGDEVTVEIEGIGKISNRVVAE